ncbi:MAG: hypothetical protein IIC85_04035 [Chloroflexi bacterium]|nr:hypothetical protein [Chloroflexota bacterium]
MKAKTHKAATVGRAWRRVADEQRWVDATTNRFKSEFVLGLVCLAPLLALSICLGARFIIRRVARRKNKEHVAAPIMLGVWVLGFPPLVVGAWALLIYLTTHNGIDTTASEANRYLHAFQLPPNASDVDFRHSEFMPIPDRADFLINENDFLAWAAVNQWNVCRFTYDGEEVHWQEHAGVLPAHAPTDWITVVPIQSVMEQNVRRIDVQEGYYFDTYDHDKFDDSGMTVVYDLINSRAYIHDTSR